jgi:hypothetical protein
MMNANWESDKKFCNQKWRIRLQNLIKNFTNKMKKAYESNRKIVTLMEKA